MMSEPTAAAQGESFCHRGRRVFVIRGRLPRRLEPRTRPPVSRAEVPPFVTPADVLAIFREARRLR